MIANNLPAYEAAEGRHQKGLVISALVKLLIHETRARFFKIEKSGNLVQLKESQIRQKVGHALRDMSVFREKGEQSKRAISNRHTNRNNEFSDSGSSNYSTASSSSLSRSSSYESLDNLHDIGDVDDISCSSFTGDIGTLGTIDQITFV